MAQQSYKKAPITEAVIQINFESQTAKKKLEEISQKFKNQYAVCKEYKNYKLVVQGKKEGVHTQVDQDSGYRLNTPDMTELLILLGPSIIVSQLAPYPGWDIFFQRFLRDWSIWKRHAGFKTVSRIGVRYINRIDIPFLENAEELGIAARYEDYLNIYPKMPLKFDALASYAVQTNSSLDDIKCKLKLNSAIVPAPILDHVSIVFDQDIIRETDLPQNDNDISTLLNQIREMKNEVFENCITDKARELFAQ